MDTETKIQTTYAILTDLSQGDKAKVGSGLADVAWTGTDIDELFEELEQRGDECLVYRLHSIFADTEPGERVRLALVGEWVSDPMAL